jgi:hypothetical protein
MKKLVIAWQTTLWRFDYDNRTEQSAIRKFGTWAKTECDECGCEFQVTRTHEREFVGKLICGDCETWDRAYKEGFSDGARMLETLPLGEQKASILIGRMATGNVIIQADGKFVEIPKQWLKETALGVISCMADI